MQGSPKQFDCKACTHKHCDSNNPASFNKWKIEGVIESNTCLLPMISPFTHSVLRFKRHYTRGFLPWPGGIMTQPNKFLQAMDIVGYE